MARAFILGAGASKFAGFPLALELWPFVRDLSGGHVQAETRRGEVTVALEQILQQVVPPAEQDRPNLEELFTLLDLADMGTAPLELLHTDWKDLRPKLMGMIADAFQWHQYNLRKDQRGFPKIEKVLKDWATVPVAGDTLITFNWDLLHEYALWTAKKWHYADGYGFPCEDAPKGIHSPVTILKLHGSVNWAQRDEMDVCPSIEHKADFFPFSIDDHDIYMKAAGQWNEGRNLITPSYLKDLTSNRLLLTLWNQAYDALSAATGVTVIGFQLHPADAPARQLIGSALLRNKNVSTVLVVSPSDGTDNWDSFCLSIGKIRKKIRMKFEDWVTGEE